MEKKILIIDDEKNLLKVLSDFLTRNGFQVQTAQEGGKGIDLYQKEHFDVVVLDLKLPDIDGVELLKELQKINSLLKVVVLTGYSEVKTYLATMESGACEYMSKPVDLELFKDVIDQILKTKPVDDR